MRRREFITLVGGAVATWPLSAQAQQADRVRRIAVLLAYTEDDPQTKVRLAAFRQGLEKRGWSEGHNVQIETRFAAGNADRFESLAKELVATQPDVILAHTTPVAVALKRESRVIPIVFVNVSDPIGSGLVGSLARPGGNITGVLLYEASIVGKWLAMLKEIAPRLERVALVANPKTTPYDYFLRAAEAAAKSLAIKLVPSPVATATDVEQAIESFAGTPNGALLLPPDPPPPCIAISSSRLRPGINYRWSTRIVSLSRLAVSCPTRPTNLRYSGWRRPMSTASCAATSPPTYPCRPLLNLKQPSTSERRNCSALPFRRACWLPPTT